VTARPTTLVRALSLPPRLTGRGGAGLRSAEDSPPTLVVRFSVFNTWTEIDSVFEGHFLERVAPGAFLRSMREDRGRIRMLFQHGRDPQVGDKPLGPIVVLREDEIGGLAEAPLLDTSYNADLLPGLNAGVYGSSFRFRVTSEDVVERPARSAYNPKGLPERTIREARLFEVGPVTFPAYAGATAGVRSLTDWFSLWVI
jgi:HK97 family phage prohead protease